jgi:hypothetical protein
MAVKLSIGLSKKVGLPRYSSLGASCYVELEIDPSLLDSNPAGFHEKVSRTFAACQQAVDDQLAQQTQLPAGTGNVLANNAPRQVNFEGPVATAEHHTAEHHAAEHHTGTDTEASAGDGKLTCRQLSAILAMVRRQQLDLLDLIQERFQLDRPEDLTIRQASRLINELNHRLVVSRATAVT